MNFLSILLAIEAIPQSYATPIHKTTRSSNLQSSKCGKERFDWLKSAISVEDKWARMIEMEKCEEDKRFDGEFAKYFKSLTSNRDLPSVCGPLRVNCAQIEPRSHRNYYDRNSKCFDYWYDTDSFSFVEKCREYLATAKYYAGEDRLQDKMIEAHLDCFKNHLTENMMTVDNIRTAIQVFEDRILFANHCLAFY